ncbi:hypothetical protein C8Q77DRAFT_1208038 [Trametes polyzona]|nr:hypothetical protein C8Q77DRAFT_1208038 [Trametes polyzona]
MAPRTRDPPPAPGLLASAFSFVTREIESFVTAATGGEVQPKNQEEAQPQASSSRVTLDGRRRTRDEEKDRDRERERERERKGKRVRKRSEVDGERARTKRRVRREPQVQHESDDERDRALRAMKKKMQPLAPQRSRSSEREAADDEDDEPAISPPPPSKKPTKKSKATVEDASLVDVAKPVNEPEPAPAKARSARHEDTSSHSSKLMPPPPTPMGPPPPPARRLMTPAPTMPGSLFPRSASMIPETPIPQRSVPRPRTPTPPPPEPIAEEAEEEEPEPDPEEPIASPPRGRAQRSHSQRSRERSADIAGPSSARPSSRHGESSERAASSSRRSLDEPAEQPPVRSRSAKGKERAYDTSGEIRVQGMERELRAAKEDHARNVHGRDDSERERDKQRIRMLEEEVARLRAELALKTGGSMLPPPPPPPPPPPLFRPTAPTAAVASTGGTENFLASARASLKRTDPPVEAPINSAAYGGARTKKAGHPTVNVPSDKMAAFLREMKNVRLRRVAGLTGNTSMGPPASAATSVASEVGELSRSTSGTGMSRARMAATLGERSFDLGVAASLEIGAKRKRDALEDSSVGPPHKRRETAASRRFDGEANSSASSSFSVASSSQSSQASGAGSQSSQASSSSSNAQSSSSRTTFYDMPPPRSQPTRVSRPRTSAPLRIWPTTSTAETDLTTPSLCSDNDNEQDNEDKSPDTPSDTGRNRKAKEAKSSSAAPERVQDAPPEHEIIDVDALETPPKRLPTPEVRSKSPAREKQDLFARRPPVSPLPASTVSPAKPKPPARAAKAKSKIPVALPRRVPVAAPEHPGPESESDDPLAGPPSRPASRVAAHQEAPRAGPSRVRRKVEESPSSSPSPSPPPRNESRAGRMTNHARRRLTLDEELRRAGDSLWQPSDEEEAAQEEGPPEPDVDSGELVALGTRSSRRGFLAKGGGAGAPVFMGEGYVMGAGDDLVAARKRARSGSTRYTGKEVRGGAVRVRARGGGEDLSK